MQLVEMRENSMMPIIFKPYLDKVIETISECDEPSDIPHWIPCTERLPDKTDKYLVTVNKNGELVTTFTVWLNQEDPKWASLDDVIAWAPMPEPWKGNE